MDAIVYHFHLPDGRAESIRVEAAFAQPAGPSDDLPGWTRLEQHQCPNCPLTPGEAPHCPMALQFVELVRLSHALPSFAALQVEVETAQRTVSKETSVQRAFSSLMGLLAATSDCPRTRFLRPMAHFHLPFASIEETIYRATATFLLARYFGQQAGRPQDWSLDALKAAYRELQMVNRSMANRLRSACELDGAVNALVILDVLAKTLPGSIDDALEEIRPMFADFPELLDPPGDDSS
ncbi:DUF6901 family protein [Chitinimonas koreensis]|uniref:DUF6901 family protein n=1 Tax=Chitinimonas koreensis TaxID=356302 RepID=UPI000421E4ED|nr:hypothetical protein [Chitinimonas koreensis]QNM97857.1 hypothetical protein H9L41_06200 [Chitinimonas koreensis]